MTPAEREAAARAVVDHYAPGAPESVRTAAVSLMCDSLRDLPYDNDTQYADQQQSTHNMGANLLRRCGAASMLAQWRRPRARAAGACAVISFADFRPDPHAQPERRQATGYSNAIISAIEAAAAGAHPWRRRSRASRRRPHGGGGRSVRPASSRRTGGPRRSRRQCWNSSGANSAGAERSCSTWT